MRECHGGEWRHAGAGVVPGTTWRRSSFSGGNGECVELGGIGAVRDSKNPSGPTVRADLGALVSAIKSGRLDR